MMLKYALGTSGQLICFAPEVLAHFRRYRQTRCFHREAGGQLFAVAEGPKFTVAQATGPRRSDRRTRTSYLPDRRAEQNEIVEQQRLGRIFIGDWHTHPEPIAKPSASDLQSIQECFRQSAHGLNGFVLVIVGTAELPESLFVSVSDGSQTHPLSLG